MSGGHLAGVMSDVTSPVFVIGENTHTQIFMFTGKRYIVHNLRSKTFIQCLRKPKNQSFPIKFPLCSGNMLYFFKDEYQIILFFIYLPTHIIVLVIVIAK